MKDGKLERITPVFSLVFEETDGVCHLLTHFSVTHTLRDTHTPFFSDQK